jgi:hypothetical protein
LTRKLRLLELALVGAIGVLSWQLRIELGQARAREQALVGSPIKPTSVPGLAPLPKFTPLTAIQYAEAAAKNLFSRDRNPNVILDPPPAQKEKPVPPFPAARGVMLWPGMPPTVVLSEKPGGVQKGYHPGEKIGDWKIVSVDNQNVGLEWDGKQFTKRLDELLDKTATIAEAPGPPQAPASAKPTASTLVSAATSNTSPSGSNANPGQAGSAALGSPAAAGPGIDTGGGFRACNAGDSTPAGAVVNGMRKAVVQTPFGSSCRWEPAK